MPRFARHLTVFGLVLLTIEFLDEFVFGAREAAWPLIRADLNLSYVQVGVLLSVPHFASSLIEPFLGILGDVWKRRVLILGGGVLFALAALLTALSQNFVALLVSFALFYPASGAFVSLSQATLMDIDPARHEHNMARWTFAGSVGVVLGPLALSAATALSLGWRELFFAFAALSALILATAWRFPFDAKSSQAASDCPQSAITSLKAGMADAGHALRRREVLRWLTLLQFSDLMLDVLLGYLALYFVDVAGANSAQAGLAVAVWSGCGLLGDLLLILLLERARGLRYLRISAMGELALFLAFLLAPTVWVKIALVGLLGLLNAGWYSILQAQLYTAMPGQSGTAMAVSNIFGLAGSGLPLALGLIAQNRGLDVAMWFLLAGPIALLIGMPVVKNSL
jgi:FSR family fosmidomycin resistance protein-like MFS transporter